MDAARRLISAFPPANLTKEPRMTSTPDQPRPAMTMREIREGLGHVQPGQPEVIVSITRYTVSVLPADDINHKDFALYVELKPGGWVVHDGHVAYASDGTWQPGQGLAHRFADYDDALAVARRKAPGMTVNGRTAAEVWQHTQAEEARQ